MMISELSKVSFISSAAEVSVRALSCNYAYYLYPDVRGPRVFDASVSGGGWTNVGLGLLEWGVRCASLYGKSAIS